MPTHNFENSKKSLTAALIILSLLSPGFETQAAQFQTQFHHDQVMTHRDIQEWIQYNDQKEKRLENQNSHSAPSDSERNKTKEILEIIIINYLKNKEIEKSDNFIIDFNGHGSYYKQEIALICNGIEEYANYPQIKHHFTGILGCTEDKLKLLKITFSRSFPLKFENGSYIKGNSLCEGIGLFDCSLEIANS